MLFVLPTRTHPKGSRETAIVKIHESAKVRRNSRLRFKMIVESGSSMTRCARYIPNEYFPSDVTGLKAICLLGKFDSEASLYAAMINISA